MDSNVIDFHSKLYMARNPLRLLQRCISCGSQHQLAAYSMGFWLGAGRGSRTPKTRRSADFESAASASSAIPAPRGRDRFQSLFFVPNSFFFLTTNAKLFDKVWRSSRICTAQPHFADEMLRLVLGL